MFRIILSLLFVSTFAHALTDRELAEWALRWEGTVLLEGRSHAEIARARRTSTRTIANQVSAIFRRLNISGRGELMSFLLK